MKTVFLYWDPHKVHAAWAESVHAKFIPFTQIKNNGILMHLVAILQSPFLPHADIYLLESPMMVTAVFWRKLFGSKIYAINSDPFFQQSKNKLSIFKPFVLSIQKIFSTSQLMQNAAKTKKYIVPIFINEHFQHIIPKKNKNWIFIGPHLNKKKGVDRLIKAFLEVNTGTLTLIGDTDSEIAPLVKHKNITVTGKISDPQNTLVNARYYVNAARIEPAGANIIEAMAAGLTPIVSDKCGVANEVAKINKKLIINTNTDEKTIIQQIIRATKIVDTYPIINKQSKEIAKQYTKENSIKKFKEAFFD